MKVAAARGLELATYEHLHTNNKPRQQTSPLTTRRDTTKTRPHFYHCKGYHYSSNTPVYTQYKRLNRIWSQNRNCVFLNSWENAHLLEAACIFGTQWTKKNAKKTPQKKPKGKYTNILECILCVSVCVFEYVNTRLFEISACVCKDQTCLVWCLTCV